MTSVFVVSGVCAVIALLGFATLHKWTRHEAALVAAVITAAIVASAVTTAIV